MTDIVVPMVFADDGVWREKYAQACHRAGIPFSIDERVRTWGLEKYFFRGVAKFMPWVRTLHLIVDGEMQVPKWLNREAVHVVYHEDIMPKEVLPTFNSQAIEMWLHRIEGLSEQFIYANDDMIAVSPMKEEDFFVDGLPVIHCGEKHHDDLSGIFRTVCRQTLDMVTDAAGKVRYPDGVLLKDGHSYAPMLLSTVKLCVEKYGERMNASCTPFRGKSNLIQYLYTYEQWESGKFVDGHHTSHYFSLGTDRTKICEIVRSGKGGVCCFNDSGSGDWMQQGAVARGELGAILGEKCRYEK